MNLMNECRKVIRENFMERGFTYLDVHGKLGEFSGEKPSYAKVRTTVRLLTGRGEISITGKTTIGTRSNSCPINTYKAVCLFDGPIGRPKKETVQLAEPYQFKHEGAMFLDRCFLQMRAGAIHAPKA